MVESLENRGKLRELIDNFQFLEFTCKIAVGNYKYSD